MNKLRLILFLLIFSGYAFGQTPEEMIASLNQDLDRFNRENYNQSISISTDQKIYLAGETIWMKISSKIVPYDVTDLTTVVYVELLSERNEPALRQKMVMSKGHGHGSLALPLTLPTGRYILCAYTKWMLNFGESAFFKKPIQIINTFQPLPKIEEARNKIGEIAISPANNTLLCNLENTVAFHLTNALGEPLRVPGFIVDEKKDTIASFNADLKGLGVFRFKPQADKYYKALIKDTIIDLPKWANTGYTLSINRDQEVLQVGVFSTNNVPVENYYAIITNKGLMKVIKSSLPVKNGIHFAIEYSFLEEGVNEIVIINQSKKIIAQGLYYIKPNSENDLAVRVDKSVYTKRERVQVEVKSKSLNLWPERYSIKVYRNDSLTDQALVESQLESYIAGADKNMLANDDDANALLMLYGRSRVNWQQVLHPRSTKFEYPPELNGEIITGTAFRGNRPAGDVLVFVTVPGKRVKLYTAKTNAEGKFSLELPDYFGDGDIVVQPSPEDSTTTIQINSPFYSHKFVNHTKPSLFSYSISSLKERHKAIQIQQAFHQNEIYSLPRNVDSTAFFGRPDEEFVLDEYNRFTTMEEVFREYVKTVMVRKHSDGLHLMALNKGLIVPKFFESDPFLMIDGVPIFNRHKFFAFDPLKIRKGSVMARGYLYKSVKANGIVSLQTYRGDLDGFPLEPYVSVIEYNGLQIPRMFYSPEYELNKSVRIPDQRNLIYWSPEIKAAEDGIGKISFYTSDQKGNYRGVVEYRFPNGDLHSTTFEYKVTD